MRIAIDPSSGRGEDPVELPDEAGGEQTNWCSFCGKGNREVETMILAPDATICGECVELCRDIVGAHRVKLSGGVTTLN